MKKMFHSEGRSERRLEKEISFEKKWKKGRAIQKRRPAQFQIRGRWRKVWSTQFQIGSDFL